MSPAPTRKVTYVRRRLPLASTAGRIRILLLMFAVLFSVAGARAIQFQVLDASDKRDEAAENLSVTQKLPALRGQILDRDGGVLAFTNATVTLFASPNVVAGKGTDVAVASQADREAGAKIPEVVAPIVAKCTGAPVAELQAKLADSSKKYVRLVTKVGVEKYNCIQNDPVITEKRLGWVIGRESDPTRVYPKNTVASNVIGYLSGTTGGAGLEQAFESTLAGTDGKEIFETKRNTRIPLGESTINPAVNGTSITTTLDSALCWQTQTLLDAQQEAMKQTWGFTVVMEVKTGKVLCLANSPSFNGNETGQADPERLGNPAMYAPYQPGSTLKLLTLAAVLDAGGATPDSVTHVADQSEGIKVGSHTVKDSEKHPAVDYTTRGILVKSSNQGTIQLMRDTFSSKGIEGKQAYLDYLTSFGLGQKTDVGLPGENAGTLPADKIMGDSYTIDAVAFGTSVTVNALQMAAAVNGVVNDGLYVQPSLIESTTSPDGTVKPAATPQTRRVVKSSTADEILGMMEDRALDSYPVIGVPGVRTGVKTGTALMNGDMISSIIGVAPVEDPQLLVYTVYFQEDSHSGAGISTAGPVYQDVMTLALQRYGILPSVDAAAHCLQGPLIAGAEPVKKC